MFYSLCQKLKLPRAILNNHRLIGQFIILFTLIIFMMPPNQWNPNEENYLGMAWRRFSPDNILQVSALKDTPNHRFLFDYITGFSILHIGFDWTHAFGRIIVALLYSASLVTFFRALEFSAIASYSILLVFVFLGEQILGGEWLFRGFEAKTLAYPLVFWSFSSFLKKKFNYSYLLLALATYFHFLVGGFWFVVTWCCQLYYTRNWKQTLVDSLNYLGVCTPLFIMIVGQQLSTPVSVNSTPSVNWLYSYFRTPHHVAPFADAQIFYQKWYRGIVYLFGLTFTSAFLSRQVNKNERKFLKLIFALHCYLVLSLIVSYFDRDGSFGKFYLFRPSSMILFLTLCLYTLLLKNRLLSYSQEIKIVAFVLIACLTIPNLKGHSLVYKRVESVVINKAPLYSIALVIKDFLPRLDLIPNSEMKAKYSNLEQLIYTSDFTDVFLIDPKLEDDYIDFERKYNRPTLVSRRFVPTTTTDIRRWYELLKLKEELFKKGCPSEISRSYNIRYSLVKKDNKNLFNCGNQVYGDEKVILIKFDNFPTN